MMGGEPGDRAYGPGGHRRGPPQEALEACNDLAVGDACTVAFLDKEITGKCAHPPRRGPGGPGEVPLPETESSTEEAGAPLVCMPENMRSGGGDRKGPSGKPLPPPAKK